MDVILDGQGFKRPGNKFVLKELAATTIQRTSTDSESSSQKFLSYVFAPPCDWDSLPAKYKSMNSWLTRNFHGLPWGFGDIPYVDVKKILEEIIKDKCYIYVKGAEKKKWLEEIIGYSKPVIDLEKLNCPSLRKLKIPHNCLNHMNHSVIVKYNCAFENVQALKVWFLKQSGMTAPSSTRSFYLYDQLKNILDMSPEDIAEFPKCFFIIFQSQMIDAIWEKLPKHLQEDKEIMGFRLCRKHLKKNGFETYIKNCIYCLFFPK